MWFNKNCPRTLFCLLLLWSANFSKLLTHFSTSIPSLKSSGCFIILSRLKYDLNSHLHMHIEIWYIMNELSRKVTYTHITVIWWRDATPNSKSENKFFADLPFSFLSALFVLVCPVPESFEACSLLLIVVFVVGVVVCTSSGRVDRASLCIICFTVCEFVDLAGFRSKKHLLFSKNHNSLTVGTGHSFPLLFCRSHQTSQHVKFYAQLAFDVLLRFVIHNASLNRNQEPP